MADAIPIDDSSYFDQATKRGYVQPAVPILPVTSRGPAPAIPLMGAETQPSAKVAPVIGPPADSQELPSQEAVNAYKAHPISLTTPIRSGLANLFDRESNIHNPILRTGTKIGTGILEGLERVGDVVAPRVTAAIPGSRLNKEVEAAHERKVEGEEARTGLQQSQTKEAEARANALENPQPKEEEEGKTVTTDQGVFQWNPETKRYDVRVGGAPEKQPKNPIIHETDQGIFMVDPETRQATPLTYQGQPLMPKAGKQANTAEDLKQRIAASFEKGDTATVKQLQSELKAIDPEGAQRIQIALGNQELGKERASRQDVREHDKAYVQPAEAVEKSYQMMDSAFREYEAARAQGKELPTGAQSMLALSTHLSTTFGNVKGSRVTKDMIQEHLGARSVSDAALVAIQKLTNGDVLSPGQWKAFHDLIAESRKLSWKTAVKEAKRKDIPIDFLPDDLQSMAKESAQQNAGTGNSNDPLGIR